MEKERYGTICFTLTEVAIFIIFLLQNDVENLHLLKMTTPVIPLTEKLSTPDFESSYLNYRNSLKPVSALPGRLKLEEKLSPSKQIATATEHRYQQQQLPKYDVPGGILQEIDLNQNKWSQKSTYVLEILLVSKNKCH